MNDRCSFSRFFPPDVPLPTGVSFPFWATIQREYSPFPCRLVLIRLQPQPGLMDNSMWLRRKRLPMKVCRQSEGNDVILTLIDRPDVIPGSPSKKSTPTGAIVGGVIGGVVVLLLGAIAAWMIRRRRMTRSMAAAPARPPIHGRSLSDLSQKSGVSATFTTTSGLPPGSPTFSPRAHSIFGSARGSIFSTSSFAPSRIGSPPLPSPAPAVVPLPAENVIVPFIIPQSDSPHRPLNRKTSNDTSIAPVRRDESTPGRRLNPPAYTPSEASSSQTHLPQGSVSLSPRQARGYGHRPGRGEKGSQDTIASTRSLGVSFNDHSGDRMAVHSRQTSADAISTIEEGSNIPIA